MNIEDHIDGQERSVLDILAEKHPPTSRIDAAALVTTVHELPEVHPVLFNRLNGLTIRNAALRSHAEDYRESHIRSHQR